MFLYICFLQWDLDTDRNKLRFEAKARYIGYVHFSSSSMLSDCNYLSKLGGVGGSMNFDWSHLPCVRAFSLAAGNVKAAVPRLKLEQSQALFYPSLR